MTANAVNGSTVVLQVRTGTGPDVYTTVGGQRGLSRSRTRTILDTSAKEDNDRTKKGGKRDSSLSLDAVVVSSDVGRAALIAAHEGTGEGRIRVTAIGAEPAKQAEIVIANIDENFPDDEVSDWTVDFEVTGPWTAIS
ncbi:MAG TPA: phage tail tube protein [Acidimicrobiales bacterium]|nr:phage tail tube protein [Acidimicrobiales bacterium]